MIDIGRVAAVRLVVFFFWTEKYIEKLNYFHVQQNCGQNSDGKWKTKYRKRKKKNSQTKGKAGHTYSW